MRTLWIFAAGWCACLVTTLTAGYGVIAWAPVAFAQETTDTTTAEPLFPSLSDEANFWIGKFATGPLRLTKEETQAFAARAVAAEQRSVSNEGQIAVVGATADGAMNVASAARDRSVNNAGAARRLFDILIEWGFADASDRDAFYTPTTTAIPGE